MATVTDCIAFVAVVTAATAIQRVTVSLQEQNFLAFTVVTNSHSGKISETTRSLKG